MRHLLHFIRLGGLLCLVIVSGCSSVNVVVDPASIRNPARFDRDSAECQYLAESYDLRNDKVANTAIGAGTGAMTTVGLASAIIGTLHVPTMPFMLAGAMGGGGAGVGGRLRPCAIAGPRAPHRPAEREHAALRSRSVSLAA